MTETPPEFVLLHTASSATEGHAIASVLKEAGIEVRVGDDLRWDEFAVFERMLNQAIEIRVLKTELERAREAIRVARESPLEDTPPA